MMEEFNVPHQKVKEKSVYLLHLDGARIILISAAVIGIIVVSFLLGMNFVNGGDGAKTLLTKNDIFDSQKELDLLKTNIPGGPEEDDLSRPIDEKLTAPDKDDKGLIKDGLATDRDASGKNKNEDRSAVTNSESADMLTNNNIKDPAAPLKKDEKSGAKRDLDEAKKVSRSTDTDSIDKPARKSAVKNVSRKKKNSRSKVVAVSEDRTEPKKASHSGSYTIQVGSFDRRASALSEARSLKDMHYDAHVDETSVKGKQYFRVRVGPLASRKKALDLLKNIQDIDGYQESYMTRE